MPSNTNVAPFVKAAARDTKAYLKSTGSKALVSYTSGDGPSSWLVPLADYLACDADADAIDIFGLNNYQWCSGSSSTATSAVWQDKLNDFEDLAVPLYLSEFGCIKAAPRTWTEVPALFSSPVSDRWSGGIAFSYFATAANADDYGMTTLSSDNTTITVSGEVSPSSHPKHRGTSDCIRLILSAHPLAFFLPVRCARPTDVQRHSADYAAQVFGVERVFACLPYLVRRLDGEHDPAPYPGRQHLPMSREHRLQLRQEGRHRRPAHHCRGAAQVSACQVFARISCRLCDVANTFPLLHFQLRVLASRPGWRSCDL